ncbi:hypothetical protein T492DRAFT_1012167 [Pavlovales sp. CCMP2436]|nr:hypothetical protein T492DRAFT_1012167 [Pavlovales sp. CCMP2436]
MARIVNCVLQQDSPLIATRTQSGSPACVSKPVSPKPVSPNQSVAATSEVVRRNDWDVVLALERDLAPDHGALVADLIVVVAQEEGQAAEDPEECPEELRDRLGGGDTPALAVDVPFGFRGAVVPDEVLPLGQEPVGVVPHHLLGQVDVRDGAVLRNKDRVLKLLSRRLAVRNRACERRHGQERARCHG